MNLLKFVADGFVGFSNVTALPGNVVFGVYTDAGSKNVEKYLRQHGIRATCLNYTDGRVSVAVSKENEDRAHALLQERFG